MDNIIEYQEIVSKTIDKDKLKHFLLDTKDTYRKEHGWFIGEIKIDKCKNENQITVSFPLIKYKISEENLTAKHI